MPEHPPPTMRTRSPHSGLPSSRRSSEIFFAAVSVIVTIRSSRTGERSDNSQQLIVSQDATGGQQGELLERGAGRKRHHENSGAPHVLGSQHPAPIRSLRDRVPEGRVHGAGHEPPDAHALGADPPPEPPAPGDRRLAGARPRGVLGGVRGARERPAAARTDLRRALGELLPRPRCEHDTRALRGERQGDRPADPPPRARDERDLPLERAPRVRQIWSPRPDLISSMNSARVSGRSRKAPSIADVTALEFCFSTPRMSMQRWIASMTTATPRGWSASFSVFAIWVVSRSCTCSRRLYISTSRGIFERPTIFLRGLYAMWALPKNGII